MSREKKLRSDYNNPCLKEQELSYKCLNDNNYDKDRCNIYFHNYRNCMDFWNKVKAARRSQGIRPYLPPPEERDSARSFYLKKFGISRAEDKT